MASDNTILNAGSGGETFPSLADASNINWPVGCSAYPTAISPGANVLQIVDATHGLPVQQQTGATFAVSAVSLPLPTGASTAANQATGNASLSSIDGKITVCDTGAVVLAAGTAVIGHVVVDSSALPTGAATAANQSTEITALNSIAAGTPTLVGGLVPVLISGQTGTVTVGGTVAVANFPATQPVSGTITADQGGTWNITNISGTVSLPTGASTAAKQPALGTAGSASADVITVQGIASMTPLAVTLTSTTITGTVAATQSGTWTVQPGNTPNTVPWLVAEVPVTSGGTTIYRNFQTGSAVIAAAVKASAGQVYSIEVFNINAAPVFVRLYNQTASPGTGDTVVWSGVVPGNTAGAGFVKAWSQGMAFGTGIGVRVTGAIADNDATALTANTVMLNIEYK